MFRFSFRVMRITRLRNVHKGVANVGSFGVKVREARLRLFGHVLQMDSEYSVRWMLKVELPGRRLRGRPRKRFMDVDGQDMQIVCVRQRDTDDRERWRKMIHCDDSEKVR